MQNIAEITTNSFYISSTESLPIHTEINTDDPYNFNIKRKVKKNDDVFLRLYSLSQKNKKI